MAYLLIDDSNYMDHLPDQDGQILVDGEKMSFGMIPRDYSRTPSGFCDFGNMAALPDIPMEEWPERIEELERKELTLYHVWLRDLNSKILDQNGTNYCHAFSPTIAAILLRAVANLPYLELSAGSVGGPVTGYKNRGAWIGQDLKQITIGGFATTDFVPMRQISKDGWRAGAVENAKLHVIEEWDELGQRNFHQTIVALLSLLPVCVGLNWWSHAVTYIRAIDTKRGRATDLSRYNVGSLNSWGPQYGQGGYFELAGTRRIPDEQYVPRITRPSLV